MSAPIGEDPQTWDRTGLLLKLHMIQCSKLDMNGTQCQNFAAKYVQYHGDSEIYGSFSDRPTWVLVPLCEECSANL